MALVAGAISCNRLCYLWCFERYSWCPPSTTGKMKPRDIFAKAGCKRWTFKSFNVLMMIEVLHNGVSTKSLVFIMFVIYLCGISHNFLHLLLYAMSPSWKSFRRHNNTIVCKELTTDDFLPHGSTCGASLSFNILLQPTMSCHHAKGLEWRRGVLYSGRSTFPTDICPDRKQ